MANRADSLIELLRQHQLLDPQQLEEMSTPEARDTDPEMLARCLIELGWITVYQLDLALNNKTQDLRIGNYLVMDKVGMGGCGPAFKVRRPGKPGVFLLKKFPKATLPTDQLAMFNQDVRLAAQIQHPHIAPVATVGQLGDQFLYVRDFVDGADLAQTVRDSGPLAVNRACALVRQTALALQHAHDKGLVHRRVKPANLVAKSNGTAAVKLVDFGLANLKPRTKEDKGDRSGDIRGLGRTLCYLLTGRAPAPPDTTWLAPPGSGPLSTLRAGIPLEVQAIAGKMLAAGVSAEGYKNMAEVVAALAPHSHVPEPKPEPAPAVNGTATPAAVPAPAAPEVADVAPNGPSTTENISRSERPGFGQMEVEAAAVPFAVAVAPAVAVERPEPVVPVEVPMAFAAPPSAVPIAIEPVSAVVAEAVMPVAVTAVEPALTPVTFPVEEPVAPPAPLEIPMASAVVAAVPPSFAVEPPSTPVEPPAPVEVPLASAVVAAVPTSFAVEPVNQVSLSATAPPEPPPVVEAAAAAPPEPVISVPTPTQEATPMPTETTPVSEPVGTTTDQVSAAPVLEAPAEPKLAPDPVPVAAAPPPPPPELSSPPPVQAEAPPPPPVEPPPSIPENIPLGAAIETPSTGFASAPTSPFVDAPPAPFTDAPADGGFMGDAGTTTRRPPKPKKKLSKSTIMWLIVGGILHLIAAGILVLAIMAMMGDDKPEPQKSKNPAVKSTPRAKTQPAGFPMENPKSKPKTTTKDGDVNPFDD